MAELIDAAVRLNMRIFKALEGMMHSKLAETIPVCELRQFVEAFLDADGWRPIESAPEDTNVLVATTGGWVDTAFWTDEDGQGRKWWWLVSANKYAEHSLHPNLIPTHWMPLPTAPTQQSESTSPQIDRCPECHNAAGHYEGCSLGLVPSGPPPKGGA